MQKLRVMLFLFLIFFNAITLAKTTAIPIVIINKESKIENLTINQKQLLLYWTLKLTHWKEDQPVVLYIYNDPTLNTIFSETILNIPFLKLEQMWNKYIFTGLSRAPIKVNDEKDMINNIETTPGSMGFILTKLPNGSTIIILKIN